MQKICVLFNIEKHPAIHVPHFAEHEAVKVVRVVKVVKADSSVTIFKVQQKHWL